MIDAIIQQLFSDTPEDTLYHYTSFTGLLGIVGTRILHASDVRYVNDAAELKHALELLSRHIRQRFSSETEQPVLLSRLLDRLGRRVVQGPMLFGASFRANGNLLSQWRGYSIHGKGVSLGFDPSWITRCAEREDFQLARCVYDPAVQSRLMEQIVDAIVAMGATADRQGGVQEALLERIEGRLLRIAAVLKHPAFAEEQEWRLVSPVIHRASERPIHFREGSSMLVPYFAFPLAPEGDGSMHLDHVYLGPTSNVGLSMNSLRLYLQQCHAEPRRGISYCQIPYRQR